MSNVRALLKAKRQEARIHHPLASYTSSGQLRCIVCGETTIKHATAWEGHLGSKAHRTNVARLREEERLSKQQELEEVARWLKRKADEDNMNAGTAIKKPKTGPAAPSPASDFPSDFFSDPSQGPPPPFNDFDFDGDGMDTTLVKPHCTTDSTLDQEFIQFQQTVINAPDDRETYDRATVFAGSELVLDVHKGLPAPADEARAEPKAKLDEEGERRRKEQEERELIMDRLMDEEHAQEEADMKVIVMKNRLAALRKKREVSRSAKLKPATP
ncbi:hypothetical protein BS17DRAFT_802154 [Gyrodon lividus]|nr:hypothetical protein BS17DRAFT_802154 [Gyrodon lividus]